MPNQKRSWSSRLYRGLLRLLPFDFRSDFGGEMEEVFQAQQADAHRKAGTVGLARLWWETIVGLFRTAPREHLSILGQDLGYAFRMMRRNAGYTTLAVVTLALGIGANTAIFSVINATLVRPLPYRQGEQLVVIHQKATKAGIADMRFSNYEVADYSEQNQTLSGAAEYHGMSFLLLGRGESQRVRTGVVSPSFFDLFGVKPVLGRTFLPADDLPGAPAVLILSYEFWQNHQGADPNIVGRTFEMNDRVHTVVGVLPPVPQYPNENDVYMPTSACPFRAAPRFKENRDGRMMSLFGRLKDGVTLEKAQADFALIASRLESQYPKSYTKAMGYRAEPAALETQLTQTARPTLLVLLGAATFVLLIACANVANITLARMAGRERELMVRAALGAGQSRLLRQLVTESLLIGLLSAGLGLAIAYQGLDLLVDFAGQLTPRAREINMDRNVLLFTLFAAVFTSVVFGSVSAFSSRSEVAAGLKEGGRATMGLKQRRLRNVLIVCQVAFSFVLLIGAGLMLRSLSKLQNIDPGFVPQRVLTMGIGLNWSKYTTNEQTLAVARQILAKAQAEPGVLSAAVASSFPLDPDALAGGGFNRRFQIEGRITPEGENPPVSAMRIASPDYFKTLGIPLIQGRTFQENDDEKALRVAVINQKMAKHHWGDADPVGRRITFNRGETWITIVGVVGDVREMGLHREPGDEIYLPTFQGGGLGTVLVRTAQEPMSVAGQLRRAVLDVDPQIAVTNVVTLEDARTRSLSSQRTTTDLLGLFAALALVIAATGIGGILALSVSERLHEIGIRIALGARSTHVIRDVIGRGVGLVMLGVAVGWAGAVAVTGMLKALLFQVTPTDPLTFWGVSAILIGAALLASYLPARRATQVDPLIALRSE